MIPCDMALVDVILNLSIGGITLRVIISWLKKLFGVSGLIASLMTIAVCLIATAVYLLVSGQFSIVCLILIGFQVYAGSQVAYSLSKARKEE